MSVQTMAFGAGFAGASAIFVVTLVRNLDDGIGRGLAKSAVAGASAVLAGLAFGVFWRADGRTVRRPIGGWVGTVAIFAGACALGLFAILIRAKYG